jgi:hypothetical protein
MVVAIYSRTKLHHRDVIDAFRFSKMPAQCSTWFRGRRFRCKFKTHGQNLFQDNLLNLVS